MIQLLAPNHPWQWQPPQSDRFQHFSSHDCSLSPFAPVIPKVNPPAAAVGMRAPEGTPLSTAPCQGALELPPPPAGLSVLWGGRRGKGTWKIRISFVKPWTLLMQGALMNSQTSRRACERRLSEAYWVEDKLATDICSCASWFNAASCAWNNINRSWLNPGLFEIRLLLCPYEGMSGKPQQLHLGSILIPAPLTLAPVIRRQMIWIFFLSGKWTLTSSSLLQLFPYVLKT